MAFGNKAKGRDANQTDTTGDLRASNKAASNQERFTGNGERKVSAGSKFELGNLVRIGANTKGTGILKRPTALAEAGKRSVKGAVENPDKGRSR